MPGRSDALEESSYLRVRADEFVHDRARRLGISRRRFLELGLGGALAGFLLACGDDDGGQPAATASPGATPVPAVKPTPDSLFRNLGTNHEMRWEAMRGEGYAVPNGKFFVRTHTSAPRLDPEQWRLRVEGNGVQRSLDLSLDDLVRMESRSVTRYLECAGNGRSYFASVGGREASGTQWLLGAIGLAEWRGVPLSLVLQEAGLRSSARDVMPTGLDDMAVRRPMSTERALEDDTLLVYEMNGAPLPPDHGAPIRVIVPGWIGVASIKWVGRIEVSEEPLYSPWNTDSYVMVGPTYEPEPPNAGPMVFDQNIKCALELAWPAQLPAGPQAVRGRAWSPYAPIETVEIRVDEEASRPAVLLPPENVARTWALFEFEWDALPGEHVIRARATDLSGNTQPDSVPFNENGYLYNGVVPHPVSIA
jgi:DMSO/TMAO reductase YedYZ molybdopterin-dependent catalytic subunit